MANVPPNDPNVDAPAIIHAPVNPDHAPAQPIGLGIGFALYWIKDNIPNNQNGKMEKFMSERIDTEGRIKKKFKEQDSHFIGLGCDNIEMDRTVRNMMSDLSGLKKL
nr:hypothetical protein [Tanacetum cinerariifolium]